MRKNLAIWIVIVGGFLFSCQSEIQPSGKLFTLLPATYTGISFENTLEWTKEFNIYTYRNFYNGGGVALADVNNDSLLDIYFCGNMKSGRLYLNKGNFQFEDVTEKAGILREGVWVTGASWADVNGDGWVDLYLCKSGMPSGENRYNELFINNGDLTFTEKAQEYGIDDKGYSTHAAFFDYDKDGDLDCYLLNNSFRAIGSFDLRPGQRYKRDSLGGNKLYRNEGGKFVDYSEEAGIYGSIIGFGLGVTVADVNRDSWQDIYVSNDFFERDYLYLNNQDGTFSESLEEQIQEISGASMGSDIGDINNDGFPDIFVTDMLPEDEGRMKTKTTFENWDRYQTGLRNGYYHQFTRNVLQLNQGHAPFKVASSYHERLAPDVTIEKKPQGVYFSEIGRLAGVYGTDWSWGALITDLDNDGWKDIFVANGIYQDLTDQDYLNFFASDPRTIAKVITKDNVDFKPLIDAIPSEPIPNYAFHNDVNSSKNGIPRFTNQAHEWGLGQPGFSNGSAYGDLDNDGDLDLITNNTNAAPFVYRNDVEMLHPDRRYLKFVLTGKDGNSQALGTEISVYEGEEVYYIEQMPMRGFESTMDHRPNLGLGTLAKVDSIIVIWPDGSKTLLKEVETNQTLYLDQSKANPPAKPVIDTDSGHDQPLFRDITREMNVEFVHKENDFVDFDRDRLIYHMMSSLGPKIAKADVNGDGREDLFMGGAKDQAGALFIQTATGGFISSQTELFEQSKAAEDTDCIFFDADGDGDPDLYVASGGNEYPNSSSALSDRLYLNSGRGQFLKSKQILPGGKFESSSCVQAGDFDADGDEDLIVGVRLKPFAYGVPANAYLLENDGKGIFKDVTKKRAPELIELGMLTDVKWSDFDQDGDLDLFLVGEWMPLTLMENENGAFKNVSEEMGLSQTEGFWNCLEEGDINGDGFPDFIVGNHGLNTRFHASSSQPVDMYVNDFDKNGTAEQIVSVYNGDQSYPLALRHDLVMQMPGLKKKYLKYENYKEQTVADIFSEDQLEQAIHWKAVETRSIALINTGKGKFEIMPLPDEAQIAPTFGILIEDFDKDGSQDLLLGGNFFRSKPEVGIYAGHYGLFLKGQGNGEFRSKPLKESGFFVQGEVRDMTFVEVAGKRRILIGKNNAQAQWFGINDK